MATNGENATKLQALNGKHKEVASLLAQGLGRSEIANIVDFTPEYVTWLTRDPLFKEYLAGHSAFHEARLEAQFGTVVDVIQKGMNDGTTDEKLRAARLQLEVTKRLGAQGRESIQESSLERLTTLAERLVSLQANAVKGITYEGQVEVVQH